MSRLRLFVPRPRPPLFLWGFMGAGKSSVGGEVARRLGVPFVDLDREIEAGAGGCVASIFAAEGEPSFRAAERALLRRELDDERPRVVALGGGALLDRELRHEALARAQVVVLEAAAETLARRVADAPGERPLLAAEAGREERIRELLAARREAYAEAHAHVSSEGRAPTEVVAEVLRVAAEPRVAVPLGARTYTIRFEVAEGVTLGEALTAAAPSSLWVVTDEHVEPHARPLLDALSRRGHEAAGVVALPPGEAAKTLASVERVLAALVAGGGDRRAVVLAIGGGVVSDVAGLAAALYLRGVRWIAAPSTWLSAVDAAIGGKTGVDLGGAKNAVGMFHQPSAVVVNLALLASEPRRSFVSGLAEVVKAALVGDPGLLDVLERDRGDILARRAEVLAPIARRCAAVKAQLVAQDEHDLGVRVVLNLGHTLGHALEAEGGFSRRLHGEAVAMGLVAALRAGVRLGVTPPELASRIGALLAGLGLPHEVDRAELAAALPYLAHDKKRDAGAVRLVVVREPGDAVVERVPLARLGALFAPD